MVFTGTLVELLLVNRINFFIGIWVLNGSNEQLVFVIVIIDFGIIVVRFNVGVIITLRITCTGHYILSVITTATDASPMTFLLILYL